MKKSETTTVEGRGNNFRQTHSVRLRKTDICVGEKTLRHAGQGAGNHSAQLEIVDGWVEDITDTRKEVFIIIKFDFGGSRRRNCFYVRDVFSSRITLVISDGVVPCKEDYQFEATAGMFPEILDIVRCQLEENGLSEHIASFERQLCWALLPLKDYCARWAKLDDCKENN